MSEVPLRASMQSRPQRTWQFPILDVLSAHAVSLPSFLIEAFINHRMIGHITLEREFPQRFSLGLSTDYELDHV